MRKKLNQDQAQERFAAVWKDVLEPEIRNANQISVDDARELLDKKLENFAQPGHQFRQFSLHSVPFIARLNADAGSDGYCDQLWDLGTHRDNTRLCVYFDTVGERQKFGDIARQLGWEPKQLGLALMTDFLNKFRS